MSQESENWNLLQTLFHLAEEASAEDRERVLAEHCSDPVVVRRALEIFSSSVALDEAGPIAPAPVSPGRVGPYTLLRLLGSGGIGSVFLAERMIGGSLQRTALKMLAPHAAGVSFIDRFHREQHILGSLDHPNITRMVDAGLTDAGQPYLVMEYVDGEHLDVYCDSRKLEIAERLQLFVHICDAVAYAHRNLIVHLDLKPSNILVTQNGVVKLLDFGTSKIVHTDSLLTTTILATPAYASPEQLRNEPVTTACDIYALGAILFELLSGQRPFAHVSIAAMIEHAMSEHEPANLADAITSDAAQLRGLAIEKLRQALQGDLATITKKCLRTQPMERYVSVDTLMQDVDRYLEGRPVLARPQTTVYRLGKFVRRNRKGFTLAAVSAVLLIAALGYAEMKQRKAIEQGRRAEEMETFMHSLFSIANSQYFGKPTMSVNDFLNLGIKALPLYIHDRADLRSAQNSLGESLWHNGDYSDAQRAFSESMKTAEADGDVNAETESLAFAADIAYREGDLTKGGELASRALQRASLPQVSPYPRIMAKRTYAVNREVNGLTSDENISLIQSAVQEAGKSRLPVLDYADTIQAFALVMTTRHRWDDAEASYRQALQLYSLDPAYACAAAGVEGQLGYIDHWRGRFTESLTHHEHALAVVKKCFGEDSADARYQERYVGQDLIWLGRGREAVDILERTLSSERKEVGTSSGPYIARALYLLANAYVMTGRPAEAAKLVEEEMRIAQGKLDPASRGYAAIYLVYAQALAGEGRAQEALPYAALADKTLYSEQPGESYPDRVQSSQAHQLYRDLQARLGTAVANNLTPAGKSATSR